MSILSNLLRQNFWLFILAAVTGIVSGLCNAGLIVLINRGLNASPDELGSLGWEFAGLGTIVLVTRALSQTLFMQLGQSAKAKLRMATIHSLANASYPHLERQGISKILTVLTQDLDAIVVFYISLPNIAMNGAIVCGSLLYLALISLKIFGVAVISLIIAVGGFRAVNKKAIANLRGSRRKEDDLVHYFRALYEGAKELKLNGARRKAFVEDYLASNVEDVRVQRTRGYVLFAAASSWGNFIFFGFIGLAIFVLAQVFSIDHYALAGYTVIFLYMIMPIESLLSAIPNIASTKIAMEHISDVSKLLPLEREGVARTTVPFRSIALRNVTHSYFREKENEVFKLGPINLEIDAGELIYLTGGNGSGKTTLAKIVTGLYTPEEGHVLLNDESVDDEMRGHYRETFSAVFNDFYLFENLFGFSSDNLDELAYGFLEQLQLTHKVKVESGRFSTKNLSRGQCKRLALLVVFLEDRPVYVFDEWAADQDPLFKDFFYKTLLPELKKRGKTVIAITHDDRYFHLADRHLKMEQGCIVEDSIKDHQGGYADERASRDT